MELSLARPLAQGVGIYNNSNPFGARPEAYRVFGLAGHNGGDYIVRVGEAVFAMYPGTVVKAAEIDPSAGGGYGKHIVIQSLSGVRITYAHLSLISVKVGDSITMLQLIGLTGNTGNSTGPHLHVTVKIAGMLNPAYQGAIDFVPFRDGPFVSRGTGPMTARRA